MADKAAEDAVRDWCLTSFGMGEVDGDVVELLLGAVADLDGDDAEEVLDLCVGVLPQFGDLAEGNPARAGALVDALVEDVRAARTFSADLREALGRAEEGSAPPSAPAAEPLTEDEAFLRSLVAGVDDSLARYVLRVRCHGERDAAAMLLVEHGSAEGLAALREDMRGREERERRRARAEEEALERSRRDAARRYGDRPVPLNPGGGGKGRRRGAPAGPVPLLEVRKSKRPVADGRRYRDGEVVATKGEKFLVIKPPEYDGGSRGRVKTKGKRGPGYR